MNILIINACSGNYIARAAAAAYLIEEALGSVASVEHINLYKSPLPPYTGAADEGADALADAVRRAEGIVFCAPAGLCAPGEKAVGCLDHLSMRPGLLSGKYVMVLTASAVGGERHASEIICRAVSMMGGFDAVRVFLGREALQSHDEAFRVFIERHAEDFYRVAHSKRLFFTTEQPVYVPTARYVVEDISVAYNIDETDDTEQPGDLPSADGEALSKTMGLGQSLRPAIGLSSPICAQLIIESGEESGFEAFISVEPSREGGRVSVSEGRAQQPDLTLYAQDEAWLSIMGGGMTTQKAFMTGQAKVRGNFAVLSRLDAVLENTVQG